MPALDTNVLVRYVVRDDDAQLRAAQLLIRQCVAGGQTLFVPVTVLLELEWVLRSRYGFGKAEVIGTLASLLAAIELRFESEPALEMALQTYRDGAADFADGLHVALAMQAAESPLWTFDQRAAAIDGARLIGR